MNELFDDADGEGVTLTVSRFVQAGSGRRAVHLRIDHPPYRDLGEREVPAKTLGISLAEADAKRLADAVRASTARDAEIARELRLIAGDLSLVNGERGSDQERVDACVARIDALAARLGDGGAGR